MRPISGEENCEILVIRRLEKVKSKKVVPWWEDPNPPVDLLCGIFNPDALLPGFTQTWAQMFYGTRGDESIGKMAFTGPYVADDYAAFLMRESGTQCIRHKRELPEGALVDAYVADAGVSDLGPSWFTPAQSEAMALWRSKGHLNQVALANGLPGNFALPPLTEVVATHAAKCRILELVVAFSQIFAKYGEQADGNYGNKRFHAGSTIKEISDYVEGHSGETIVLALFLKDLVETLGFGFDNNGIIGINGNVVRPDHGEGSVGTLLPHPMVLLDPERVSGLYDRIKPLVDFFISQFGVFPYSSLDIGLTPNNEYLFEGNMRKTNVRGMLEKVYKVLRHHGLLKGKSVAQFHRETAAGTNGWAMVKTDKMRTDGHTTFTEVCKVLAAAGVFPFNPVTKQGFVVAHQLSQDDREVMMGMTFVAWDEDPKVAMRQAAELYIKAHTAAGDEYLGEIDSMLL